MYKQTKKQTTAHKGNYKNLKSFSEKVKKLKSKPIFDYNRFMSSQCRARVFL